MLSEGWRHVQRRRFDCNSRETKMSIELDGASAKKLAKHELVFGSRTFRHPVYRAFKARPELDCLARSLARPARYPATISRCADASSHLRASRRSKCVVFTGRPDTFVCCASSNSAEAMRGMSAADNSTHVFHGRLSSRKHCAPGCWTFWRGTAWHIFT